MLWFFADAVRNKSSDEGKICWLYIQIYKEIVVMIIWKNQINLKPHPGKANIPNLLFIHT